jgi:DNA-directed RNA polymerase omega subunit
MMQKSIRGKKVTNMDCKYSFVMAVVKRAKELRRLGKEKNVPLNEIAIVQTTHNKPLTVALEEFNSGKIGLKLKVTLEEIGKEKELESLELQPLEKETTKSSDNKESKVLAKKGSTEETPTEEISAENALAEDTSEENVLAQNALAEKTSTEEVSNKTG